MLSSVEDIYRRRASLTNPAVLFALLYYRTAYSPEYWAAFDSRQLNMGWAAGLFDVDFLAKCVIM